MKLFYREYGNGPPLIILHGLYGSSDNWITIAKNLAEMYTVYLPDQRNHGNSFHDNIHDYESMRADLFELAAELNLKKFFLAGHSMGGKIAISFALKWPEMIEGLLIADISPFVNETYGITFYNEHYSILKAILSIDLSLISSRREAESVLLEKIPSEKVRGFVLKNLHRISGNNFAWKINAGALLNNLEKIMAGIDRPTDADEQISGFPVIFLKGEDSDHLPSGDFSDIQRVFPSAEFINVQGAGHWIHSDRPDEVIKNLKRLSPDN
jgi:pimeloyl-ACP methyl ester carboxylesterase